MYRQTDTVRRAPHGATTLSAAAACAPGENRYVLLTFEYTEVTAVSATMSQATCPTGTLVLLRS
jgi:hypothetical protein